MKKLLVLAMLVFALASVAIALAAGPPPSGRQGKSNNASLTLVSKDASWNVVWPGPFGELKYNISNAGGFEARLIVHGLIGPVYSPSWPPGTYALAGGDWYLVTLQKPGVANYFAGANCLFGPQSAGWGSWCDVALFKTNADGDANVIIPTTSGLTAADLLVGTLGTGALDAGSYSGLTVAVKHVGKEPGYDKPDVGPGGLLMTGGHGVLFEANFMETFAVGP